MEDKFNEMLIAYNKEVNIVKEEVNYFSKKLNFSYKIFKK